MSNYNLEEDSLLKLQINLSIVFIFTLIISITLSYNSMTECEGRRKIYSDDEALDIRRVNRIISFLVAIGFIYINTYDKKIKNRYGVNDELANVQIAASFITLISSILVLYVAFSGSNSVISGENPN